MGFNMGFLPERLPLEHDSGRSPPSPSACSRTPTQNSHKTRRGAKQRKQCTIPIKTKQNQQHLGLATAFVSTQAWRK